MPEDITDADRREQNGYGSNGNGEKGRLSGLWDPESTEKPTRRRRGRSENPAIWTPPDAFRLLTALRQGFVWMVLAPIFGLIATVGYLLWTDPVYDVGAQLMVRFGQELAAPPTVSAGSSQQVIPMSKRIEDTNGEVQIMKDPAIVRAVVYDMGEEWFYGEGEAVTLLQKIKKAVSDLNESIKEGIRNAMVRVGLLPELSRLDRVVLLLQSSITIEPVTRADVIELSLSYPDPGIGEEILRRFIAEYFERRNAVYRDDQVEVFFNAELDQITAELETAERAYDSFLQDNTIWSLEDQRGMAVANRDSLQRELAEAQTILEVSETRLAAIDAELGRQADFIPLSQSRRVNPQRNELELKRVDLLLDLAIERQLSGARSQQVRSTELQLAEIDSAIAALPETVDGESVNQANPIIERLQVERVDTELLMEATRKKIGTIEADIARIEGELARLGAAGVENARRVREIERLRETHMRYQRGYDEARIASEVSAARISNVAVIAEPQAGIAPAKPRVKRTLILSIVLSVFAAAGLILLIDAMRPRIRNNRDLLNLLPPGTLVRAIPETRGGA